MPELPGKSEESPPQPRTMPAGRVPIAAIQVLRKDFLTPPTAPITRLLTHAITRTLRHGKKLFLIADDGQTLHIHLGMSGRVDCLPATAAPCPKSTPISSSRWPTKPMSACAIRAASAASGTTPPSSSPLTKETADLGPDALSLTIAHLAHWRTDKGRLKQRLLSQHDVAGLGNIYVDEALLSFPSLHPLQQVSRITPAQLDSLVHAIREVLENSIRSGGTTLRDYRNVSDQPGQFARKLQAYGRAGKPCLRCQTALRSATIAARTTVFCPTCQRAY